jgi:hypothetical protein
MKCKILPILLWTLNYISSISNAPLTDPVCPLEQNHFNGTYCQNICNRCDCYGYKCGTNCLCKCNNDKEGNFDSQKIDSRSRKYNLLYYIRLYAGHSKSCGKKMSNSSRCTLWNVIRITITPQNQISWSCKAAKTWEVHENFFNIWY